MAEISVGSLDELLEGLKGHLQSSDNEKPRNHYRITEVLMNHDYQKACPYKVGDFVTPKESSNKRRPGEPCYVVYSYDQAQYSPGYSGKPLQVFNMVIARPQLGNEIGEVLLYPANSDDYEPYKGLVYGDGGENGKTEVS